MAKLKDVQGKGLSEVAGQVLGQTKRSGKAALGKQLQAAQSGHKSDGELPVER